MKLFTKKFNKKSIVKPVDELDMLAYEHKCIEEQASQKRKDEFKSCKVLFDKKPEPMSKEARQEMAKKANANSKAKVKMHKENPNMKSARESAKWMSKLLDQQEKKQRELDMAKTPVNFLEEPKVVDNTAFVGKIRKFTASDRIYEKDRRRRENAKASEFLGHPAMASAAVFDDGIMAVQAMINHNPAELGCKWLFEAIEIRKNARNDLYAQIDDLENLRDESIKSRFEASKSFNDCVRLGGGNDLETYRLVIENDKECYKALTAKIHEIRKQIKEINAELKVLNKALKDIRNDASEVQKALIDARANVYAMRCKNRNKKPVGRPIMEADKLMLKGYKLMHFGTSEMMSQFTKVVSSINKAAIEAANIINDENSTDDDKVEARAKLRNKFDEALAALNTAKEAGKKIILKADNAKVHNGRQSQLTDIIGVPYGKMTDMIISVNHSVANVFVPAVNEYLNGEDEKDIKDIKDIMGAILAIATTNGLDVLMLPNDKGERRCVSYKFWNSNNSQLKVGKFIALSNKAYERAADVAHAGMSEEEFEDVWCNGSDLLKWGSYAITPGCPMMYNGEPITVNDVLVVKSISAIRKFANVLRYKDNGESVLETASDIERTLFDGEMLFLVPIRSQQGRGGFAFKYFGTCAAYEDGTTMIDEIAAREGLDIPDTIEDLDGVQRNWRKYKMICTEDCWKWGWKIGAEKRVFSYAEYCTRMNKLAEKYPTANMMYSARVADATEESKRRLTRQSIQQFIFATHAQIERLTAKSLHKLEKWSTHDGVLRVLAGLDKPEDERTAFEHLIEVCPELLDHPYMQRSIEDMYHRKVAEAAVRPEVNGIYPYLAEDPVAFIKIVFWKMDPNKKGIGYLRHDQVNAPETDDEVEMYLVRYPNNYLCGRVRKNHNDSIYRCVGNVIILSIDGGFLVVADGDSDGDEVCAIFDKVVVEMMKQSLIRIKPPVVAFPHDKLEKKIVHGNAERAAMIAKAMVIANMYGPEVGKNSNLATKFMHRAATAYKEYELTNDSKKQWLFKTALNNAIVAHIAAIIAIDLAKTGKMPAWLEKNLSEISKFAGKKMPWNQRFCKDSKATPWYLEAWDDKTLELSEAVCDKVALYVIEKSNAMNYKAPTGLNVKDGKAFDIHDLLGSKEGLYVQGSAGKLNIKNLRSLEARNYREKNSEEDDEFKLIEKLKSNDPEKKVNPSEIVRFLWRNQASLVYVLQREGSDKLDNARMQNAYYDFCSDILGDFGSYCGNDKFAKLDPETRRKSNVYKFVENAFDSSNSIAKAEVKKLESLEYIARESNAGVDNPIWEEIEALKDVIFAKKASFAMFNVKVFAYDLYVAKCEELGVEVIWKKPVNDETSDEADDGEYYDESIGNYYDEMCA